MIIDIKNITKKYGENEVLNVENVHIPAGQTFGLVGNNGAGKTTLFRSMLDLIRTDSGEITFGGINVSKSEEWKSFTGSFLDENFLIDFLTADEYFEFVRKLYGLSLEESTDFLLEMDEIFSGEITGQKKFIRDLSKGNQKKVGIAAAMMVASGVLMLDEPFANLDPSTQIRLKKKLSEWSKEKNITLVISSHDLSHVTEVCERIVVLEKGRVITDVETSASTLQELESYFSN